MTRRKAPALCAWPILALALALSSGASPSVPPPIAPTGAPLPPSPGCPVTLPARDTPAAKAFGLGWHGNRALWTNLWMWGEGQVQVPPSLVRPDGSFGELIWAWYRVLPGRLVVEGRRLDQSAPPLEADTSAAHGDGRATSWLEFPTAGCWEVTGRMGQASLTFVTLVVPPSSAGTPVALP